MQLHRDELQVYLLLYTKLTSHLICQVYDLSAVCVVKRKNQLYACLRH